MRLPQMEHIGGHMWHRYSVAVSHHDDFILTYSKEPLV
jgi:hypothetical protein